MIKIVKTLQGQSDVIKIGHLFFNKSDKKLVMGDGVKSYGQLDNLLALDDVINGAQGIKQLQKVASENFSRAAGHASFNRPIPIDLGFVENGFKEQVFLTAIINANPENYGDTYVVGDRIFLNANNYTLSGGSNYVEYALFIKPDRLKQTYHYTDLTFVMDLYYFGFVNNA